MDFCKKRALAYLDEGDVQNAITSMLSDLGKYDENSSAAASMAPIGLMIAMNNDIHEARKFIEGFT